MALQHADNFSIYGANAAFMLNGVYADNSFVSLVTDPDGVSGGHVINLNTNFAHGGVRRVLSNTETVVGIAARLWQTSLPFSKDSTPEIQWKDAGNNILGSIGCDTTGRLCMFLGVNGASGTAVQTTTTPVVTANAWWHIEAAYTNNGTTVSWEIRVEGVTVMTGSQALVQNPTAQVVLGAYSLSPYASSNWKDFVVWDGTGSQNNNFLGSVLVTALTTTSDVLLNWTPSTGTTGFPILADVPPDDTKFISGDIAHINLQYKGGLSDLPTTVTSVKGLITFVRAAKQDGGDGSLQNGIISGASTGLGANRPITTAQTYWQDVFELNPATSAAWTVSAVNAANIQINRTV